MPVQDPAAANTSLWSAYLQDGWVRVLDPLGQYQIADAIAAGIAGWLNLVVAPQIAAWYGENEADVSRFLAEDGTPPRETSVVPPQYRREEAAERAPVASKRGHEKRAAIPSGR